MTLTPVDAVLLLKAAKLGLLRSFPAGTHISFTGRLSLPRADMVTLIRALGAHWDEQPTLYTHYLVMGDTGRFGLTAKMRQAEQRDTRLLTEQDFIAMISPS